MPSSLAACSSSRWGSANKPAWAQFSGLSGGSRVGVAHVAFSQSQNKSDLVRSIRAMPIKLVRVSKDNSKAAHDMAQDWITKLSRQVWHSLRTLYAIQVQVLGTWLLKP